MASMENASTSSSPPLQPRIQRCPQCKPRLKHELKKITRNLVVCIDGTSNKFGQKNTNVVKLFSQIDQEVQNPKQFAYYSSGVGTQPNSLYVLGRMKQRISDALDTVIAWNIEEIIMDAYRWLAEKYEDGDQIYLFGFSRGAYQVRVLAGMIHEVGLTRTPTEKQIGEAYNQFEAIRSGKPDTRQVAREFKNVFSWDLRVHFIGVWDTVSSVGLVRGDLFLSTSSSAAHACHFRHALALDERRVKFMPEYFHEMNSQTGDKKSKYIVFPKKGEHTIGPTEEVQHFADDNPANCSVGEKNEVPDIKEVLTDDNPADCSAGKKNKAPDIKEVWFAGCHSDVGGASKPGRSHLSGNVSLLWMRREARQNGLELQPTDLVWVPADIDLGTSNSMCDAWPVVECMPVTHQVSFSGSGKNARRPHLFRPRCIIPGQKVHASILHANAYIPRATRGGGFDISILEDVDAGLDDQIWETGLFDDTAAKKLLEHLDKKEGVLPIYLDRLLFMLRSSEGKRYVRNVPDWSARIEKLAEKSAPLVTLIAIIAYCEASCDPDMSSPTPTGPPEGILDDAEKSFRAILSAQQHRDSPRVIALLEPMTKHEVLRKHILTEDVLGDLVKLLDRIALRSRLSRSTGNFGQAMEGFICLLQFEDTQKTIIGHLATDYHARKSRLSRILETSSYSPQLLVAALRMTLTLARISSPEAKHACSSVKPWLEQLATRQRGLVGLLVVEVLLTLGDLEHFNSKTARVNLANALIHFQFEELHRSEEHCGDPRLQTLRTLFGLDAENLDDRHRMLIEKLKKAVETGSAQEQTAFTMTLLKLCKSANIRKYVRDIGLLDMFIDQLRHKDKALVAAYALAACLKYEDMMQYVNLKECESLPKNIVGMLRLDYFDDAVGAVEGFQIFGDFMQHDDLRDQINRYNITAILNKKLGQGKLKEIRTSLICLDIFRSFDEEGPWTKELVENSLENLRDPAWKMQKAGVTILSALARTNRGESVIGSRIVEIVEMLLPESYLPVPQASSPEPLVSSDLHGEPQSQRDMNMFSGRVKAPSWMMGPACALRILARNGELRHIVRSTFQYASLKHLYLSGTLVDETDTWPWHIKTPNRSDVIDMLDKMIKAVDEELSEEDLTPIDDEVLPDIRHWDRLIRLISSGTVVAIAALPIVLGVAAYSLFSLVGTGIAVGSVRLHDSFTSRIRKDDEARIGGPKGGGQEKK